jgi:hypothetical protein
MHFDPHDTFVKFDIFIIFYNFDNILKKIYT